MLGSANLDFKLRIQEMELALSQAEKRAEEINKPKIATHRDDPIPEDNSYK